MKKYSSFRSSWAVFVVIMLVAAFAPVSALAADDAAASMPAGLYPAYHEALSAGDPAYAASANNAGASLRNPAQGFGAAFSEDGMMLDAAGAWAWGISLRAAGRGSNPNAVAAPDIVVDGARVEYRRGNITEWYVNAAPGIEQGFTIHEKPNGSGRLVLHLDVHGDLAATLQSDARGITYAAPGGQTIRYANLRVWDASGSELSAKLVSTPGKVIIQVTDKNAAYPITIDPIIYLESKVFANDAAFNDQFGTSVALDGDTALIGAPLGDAPGVSDSGSAYIFTRSGTTWVFEQELFASDAAANNRFGFSVALDGNTALVGANWGNQPGLSLSGKAYVFTRTGTTWTQQQILFASDAVSNNQFGYSVALDGDTALVGASFGDAPGVGNSGSAYVFTRTGTTWTQQQELVASDATTSDSFGAKVALDGDTALVGAAFNDAPGASNTGAAYVFTRSGITWTQQQKLIASDPADSDWFGFSVALDGDTALVGAIDGNTPSLTQSGTAYVFTRSGTTWTQQQELFASDALSGDDFGYSVALNGDTALIGAYFGDTPSVTNSGSAYVFTRTGTTWTQQQELFASDAATNERFGYSVALDGDQILAGAPQDTHNGISAAGSAYFFHPYRNDVDISVGIGANTAAPIEGQSVAFTIGLTNYGPSAAPGVMIDVPLPAGLTYTSSLLSAGTYDASTGSWNVGSMPVGGGATLIINATVAAGTAGDSLVTTASLLGSDLNNANNIASTSLTVAAPAASLSPDPLNFGNQTEDTTSAAQVVTLSNTGTAALNVTNVTVSGEFARSGGTCVGTAFSVAVGSSCTIGVTFSPTTTGAKAGTLTITSNAPTSPDTVDLAGTGTSAIPPFSSIMLNPSFETDSNGDGLPDSWKGTSLVLANDRRDCTTFYLGACSFRMTGNGNSKLLTQDKVISGGAGHTFNISIFAKASAAGGTFRARITLFHVDGSKQVVTINFTPGTYNFTGFPRTITSTEAYRKLRVQLEYRNGSGTVWFDAVSVTGP